MNRRQDIQIIVVILAQILLAVLMSDIVRASNDIEIIKAWLPVWEVLILALALLSIFSIKNVYSNAREQMKMAYLKEHLQQMENLMTVLQTEKHEFTRHLQALQSLIYLERNQEARQYLDGIAERYWNIDDSVFIAQPELNSLVNSKLGLAKSQGIEFTVASICDFSRLKVEPWDLCSIIGNLLDNAIEAALLDKEHPRVEVEFEFQNGNYDFCIRNNGATISKEDQERIFQAGFSKSHLEGRGYGLYIVQKLVERYQGGIEVFSDKRTTVLITIPGEKQCA